MKALQVVFGLGLGGVERTAQNCAAASQELGYQTTVLTFQDGPRSAYLQSMGVTVIGPSDIPSLPEQDTIALHSHGLASEAVNLLLDDQPSAFVCEMNVFSGPTPWMERVDVSFQLSPWAHWLYGKRGGDLSRSSTLCNPIDPSAFWRDDAAATEFRREYSIPSDAMVIGRVGQPLSMKWSPHIYAKVCEWALANPSAHLVLVGAPAEITSLVRRSLPSRCFTLIDQIGDDERLRAAYSAMDLFVHAARQGESFGNVIAEAGLCGVPTLTTATPWADNSQGYVAGPSGFVASSTRNFVALLGTATQDRDELARRGRIARDHVLEHFSATNVVNQVMAITRGDQLRVPPPTRGELIQEIYLGQRPLWMTKNLAHGANSIWLGPVTGQETWKWAATVKLNSWGISRQGFHRVHAR